MTIQLPRNFFGKQVHNHKPAPENGELQRPIGCTSPLEITILETGARVRELRLFPCRKCPACRKLRLSELLGRGMAETWSADSTFVSTLTYGRDKRPGREYSDHPHAHELHYPDVQIFIKIMRDYLIPIDPAFPSSVHYFVAGEYGSQYTERAHWHVIIFLRNASVPNLQLGVDFMHDALTIDQAIEQGKRYKRAIPLWAHGWSFWTIADTASALGYACKYAAKTFDDPQQQSIYHASAGLGVPLIRNIGLSYADQGLVPQNGTFQVPGHTKTSAHVTHTTDGPEVYTTQVPERFLMTRSSAAHMTRALTTRWLARSGKPDWPASDWLDARYEEQIMRDRPAKLRAAGASLDQFGDTRATLLVESLKTNLGYPRLHWSPPGYPDKDGRPRYSDDEITIIVEANERFRRHQELAKRKQDVLDKDPFHFNAYHHTTRVLR